jgi:hypothetical protein
MYQRCVSKLCEGPMINSSAKSLKLAKAKEQAKPISSINAISISRLPAHLEHLTNAGLLEASGTLYKTTQRGAEALGHIVALRMLLGPATSSED